MYYFLRCGEYSPVLEAYIFFNGQKLLYNYVNKNNNLAELEYLITVR